VEDEMTDQTIRLAPCRIEDIGAVLELWDLAHIIPLAGDTAAALRLRLERDADLFLLAWSGKTLVGTLIGGWDGWRGGMYRLATHPDFRRRGIARMLVQSVEDALRARGATRITSLVVRREPGSPEFWKSVGYQPDTVIDRYAKVLD
jgi:ribosomal protein S18 acetylase RimI-like enzyme